MILHFSNQVLLKDPRLLYLDYNSRTLFTIYVGSTRQTHTANNYCFHDNMCAHDWHKIFNEIRYFLGKSENIKLAQKANTNQGFFSVNHAVVCHIMPDTTLI